MPIVFRFAQFDLDPHSARLRSHTGEVVRLRPKSFDMLCFLASNAGRTVSKNDLMSAVWPNVHVGEDSLFQCIREIRAALGDEKRELIKLISGRGYLLDTEVTEVAQPVAGPSPVPRSEMDPADPDPPSATVVSLALPPPAPSLPVPVARRWSSLRGGVALAFIAGIGVLVGIAAATPLLSSGLFTRSIPIVAVMPITATDGDAEVAAMAARVTDALSDGLAGLAQLRVLAPPLHGAQASLQSPNTQPDLVLNGELVKDDGVWTIRARLSNGGNGELRWTQSTDIATAGIDSSVQQSRLTAAIGYPLAARINAIINSGATRQASLSELPVPNARVAIEQATAAINRTSPERFRSAQTMLEKAITDDPDNVDLKAALAAHLLRGIQLVWYDAAQVPAIEASAQDMLEQALRRKPTYLPVLEGYCRLLTATNQFIESVVACGRTLAFNPWSGQALYNLGLSQLQLGQFDEALIIFSKADSFDTPAVQRWTWMLGAGIACMLMNRDEDAVAWLTRSIAVTAGTGRTHAMLTAAYQRLGRADEAKAALARTMELRPGSNALNIRLPSKNQSAVYRDATQKIMRALTEAGLPES